MSDFKARKKNDKAGSKALLKAAKKQEAVEALEKEEVKIKNIKKAVKKERAVSEMMKAFGSEVKETVDTAKTPKITDM
jgi:type II secretory pathway component PulF